MAGWASAQTLDANRSAEAQAKSDSAAATARAQQFEAQAAAANDEAERVRAHSAAVAARIQSTEADVSAATAQIAVIESLRGEQRARLAAQQGPTIRLMAALQGLARRPPALALVQPGSLNDLVHVRAILATILPIMNSRTAGLRAEVSRGRALREAADQAVAGLRASEATLVTQRNQLASLAVERRNAANAFTGSAMVEQDRAMALGEQARDIADLMTRIDSDADVRSRLESLPGPVMRPLQPGQARPLAVDTVATQNAQAPYRLPVVGQVMAGLGEVSDAGVRARGLTIATHANAQVVAPTGGRIAYAGPFRGYGAIVIIDHGSGWTTLLTSLAALDVRVGDQVDQGSPIGRAGPVRPTITVELRRQGQPVDITRLVR